MKSPAFLQHSRRIFTIYREPEYYQRLFRYALPIFLQSFITSSLNLVGATMIGQLGETTVASVGLSNQVFFLLSLLLFGINSGAAIFTAQLWGKGDAANVRRVFSLALGLSLAAGALFSTLAVFFPARVLSIYTTDPAVISVGSQYLNTFGLSFLFTAITFTFAAVLRSVGDVKTPLFVSMIALSLNVLLSYGLIFGNFGLPRMGVLGAGIAVVTARFLECSAMVFMTYHRGSPAAVTLRDFTGLDREFVLRVLRRVLPVAANEMIWSLGITTYNIVYARISTESIAAMNIAATIDNLALVFFMGMAHACAILVGHWIGAGQNGRAYHYAGKTLSLGMVGGVLMGIIITLGSGSILRLYKVSPEVITYARQVLVIISVFLWLRVANMIFFIGIFRSGGDTRFAFFLDCGAIWLIGVPLALLGGFVFHLPVYLVYLLVITEELFKFLVGLRRFFSRKWINNLAQNI